MLRRIGYLMACLLLVTCAAVAWYLQRGAGDGTRTDTFIVAPEVPIVMRSPGGLLEVATVRVFERLTRNDTRQFWGLDLGTTVSQLQVTVVYRYHIPLAREWPMTLTGRTCIVRAPDVRPSLPVAFDSNTLQKYTRSGWARFNKDENLAALEHSLTPELARRADSQAYMQLAREAGRATISEFVTTWLVKEHNWKRDPYFKVIVLYPGEAMPAAAGLGTNN